VHVLSPSGTTTIKAGETQVFSDPGEYPVIEVNKPNQIFFTVKFADGQLNIDPGNNFNSGLFEVSSQLK
jgi:hypothetical protein